MMKGRTYLAILATGALLVSMGERTADASCDTSKACESGAPSETTCMHAGGMGFNLPGGFSMVGEQWGFSLPGAISGQICSRMGQQNSTISGSASVTSTGNGTVDQCTGTWSGSAGGSVNSTFCDIIVGGSVNTTWSGDINECMTQPGGNDGGPPPGYCMCGATESSESKNGQTWSLQGGGRYTWSMMTVMENITGRMPQWMFKAMYGYNSGAGYQVSDCLRKMAVGQISVQINASGGGSDDNTLSGGSCPNGGGTDCDNGTGNFTFSPSVTAQGQVDTRNCFWSGIGVGMRLSLAVTGSGAYKMNSTTTCGQNQTCYSGTGSVTTTAAAAVFWGFGQWTYSDSFTCYASYDSCKGSDYNCTRGGQ